MNQAEQVSAYLINIENMIRAMSWHKVRFLQKRETADILFGFNNNEPGNDTALKMVPGISRIF
jgi:hypothetical protein